MSHISETPVLSATAGSVATEGFGDVQHQYLSYTIPVGFFTHTNTHLFLLVVPLANTRAQYLHVCNILLYYNVLLWWHGIWS